MVTSGSRSNVYSRSFLILPDFLPSDSQCVKWSLNTMISYLKCIHVGFFPEFWFFLSISNSCIGVRKYAFSLKQILFLEHDMRDRWCFCHFSYHTYHLFLLYKLLPKGIAVIMWSFACGGKMIRLFNLKENFMVITSTCMSTFGSFLVEQD